MNRTRKIVVTIWVLLGVFLMTGLDALFGGPRFVSSHVNLAVGLVISWLPLVCVILLTRLPRRRARLLGFIVLIPVAALCVLGSLGDAAGEAAFPATVVPQSRVRVGYSQIVTYYSDAGTLDDGNVFVQQEIKLLPGLLWVKPVFEPCGVLDVKVKALNRHYVECDYIVYNNAIKNPPAESKRSVVWVF